ncbi:MAG: hypothetical protein AAB403_12985 [Planctomycetota bacterium]
MADNPIKSINDLFENAAPLRYVANKHFPNECYERYLLLKVADSYGQLAMFTFHLTQARKHIEHIRSIGLPDKSAIMYFAHYMENISAALTKQATSDADNDAAKAVKQVGEFLHVWYSLCLALDPLMEISADFLFLTDQPKGNG